MKSSARYIRAGSVLIGIVGIALAVSHKVAAFSIPSPRCTTSDCTDRLVTRANDDDADNSLRAIIESSCKNPGDDVIQFSLSETIELHSSIKIPRDCDGRIMLYGRTDFPTIIDGSGAQVSNYVEHNCLISVESDDNVFENITIVGYRNSESALAKEHNGVGICFIGNNNLLNDSFIGVLSNSDGTEGNDIGIYISGDGNIITGTDIGYNTLDGILIEGNGNLIKGNFIGHYREACWLELSGKGGGSGTQNSTDVGQNVSNPSPDDVIITDASDEESSSGSSSQTSHHGAGCQLDTSDEETPTSTKSPGYSENGCPYLSNGRHGIHLIANASDNSIGDWTKEGANTFILNGAAGVRLDGNSQSLGNRITVNSFARNHGLGIDLGPDGVTENDFNDEDVGPNTLINYPSNLKAMMRMQYSAGKTLYKFTIFGQAPVGYEVQVYLTDGSTIIQPLDQQGDQTGFGEGEYFLLSFVNKSNPFIVDLPGNIIRSAKVTAIAIDTKGNTSEFSQNVVLDQDTDGDGIVDIVEDKNMNELVDAEESNPFDPDSDDDGLTDSQEDRNLNGVNDEGETRAFDPDGDDDGVSDYIETRGDGKFDSLNGDTNPLDPDTDCDGLTDGQEDKNGNGKVEFYLGETDPKRWDSDGDGFSDGTFAGGCPGSVSVKDMCPTISNPDQIDGNGNHIGDVCEIL